MYDKFKRQDEEGEGYRGWKPDYGSGDKHGSGGKRPGDAIGGGQGQIQVPGWQTQLEDIMGRIQNRDPFRYDFNADALYNAYKDRYIQQGNLAMQDTMGQAAALTGGYGNSYAQSVGQQTYQGYMQGLNDRIPELYQLALDKYTREGNDMMDQYGMLSDQQQFAEQQKQFQQQMALQQAQLEFQKEQARKEWEWQQMVWDYEHPAEVASSGGDGGGGGSPKPGGGNDYEDLKNRLQKQGLNSGEMLQLMSAADVTQAQKNQLLATYQKPQLNAELNPPKYQQIKK